MQLEFGRDEEYFAAFLTSVISGSTELDPLQFPTASRNLTHNPPLRSRIDAARHMGATTGKCTEVIWTPELERIERVIVKNARGHVLFELGQPIELPPTHVNIVPIEQLSPRQLSQFEHPQGCAGWPEVGSRLMLRLLETDECGEGGCEERLRESPAPKITGTWEQDMKQTRNKHGCPVRPAGQSSRLETGPRWNPIPASCILTTRFFVGKVRSMSRSIRR